MARIEGRLPPSGAEPFSSRVKAELAGLKVPGACCARAELTALLGALASLVLGGGERARLELVTEHAGTARRVFTLARKAYDWRCQILTRRRSRLRKNRVYMVVIPYDLEVRSGLWDMGFSDSGGIPRYDGSHYLVDRPCCQAAYLRGWFLGGGSILSPDRGYHLSLSTGDEREQSRLLEALRSMGVAASPGTHRGRPVLYVKEGESVARVLQLAGAHQSLLEFEGRRVVRDMRNLANRLVNAETANMDKAVRAGLRLARAIGRLEKLGMLEELPPDWQELARLRARHPELSLRELGSLMDPPLSKGAVHSRLRRMEDMAQGARPGRSPGDRSIDTLGGLC